MSEPNHSRLMAVELDAAFGGSTTDVEHERLVAIHDLVESNTFSLSNGIAGPYRLQLSSSDGRLLLGFLNEREEHLYTLALSLAPFRRILKDYFAICESYDLAVRNSTPAQIETIDMARRGIHNDGSTLLMERLQGKAQTDFETARRLFTLICALLRWT